MLLSDEGSPLKGRLERSRKDQSGNWERLATPCSVRGTAVALNSLEGVLVLAYPTYQGRHVVMLYLRKVARSLHSGEDRESHWNVMLEGTRYV